MKNKLLTFAGALALLAVLGHFYGKPLVAQVRAALIQNVDEPGRNPLDLRVDGNGFATVSIPAGKRYVIEAFSGDCSVDKGSSVTAFEVATQGGKGAHAFAPGFLRFIGFPGDEWAAGALTRLYAEPGSTVALFADSTSSAITCNFYLSGYAINLP